MPTRVVVSKVGLDGHDRGAKIIARALRDAGVEVIYTCLHQTPEQIVETATQEDADAGGISVLSGAHMTLVPRILDLLKQNGAADVAVVVGHTIPDDDAEELRHLGVAGVFGPGTTTAEIVRAFRGALEHRVGDCMTARVVAPVRETPNRRCTGALNWHDKPAVRRC